MNKGGFFKTNNEVYAQWTDFNLVVGDNVFDIKGVDSIAPTVTNYQIGTVAITAEILKNSVTVDANGEVGVYPKAISKTKFSIYVENAMTVTVSLQTKVVVGVDVIAPPIYNFDLTLDWAILRDRNRALYPVTDQASFTQWLTNGYNSTEQAQNDFTNIIISDFIKVGNNIKCNLTAEASIFSLGGNIITNADKIGIINGLSTLILNTNQIVNFNPTIPLPNNLTVLDLKYNQIVNFNPTIPLPNNLQNLNLAVNQIVNFNPTIPLPNNLTNLYLAVNQFTLAGYTETEPWANSLPISTDKTIDISDHPISVAGTNLEAILISKGWTVIV
jgi:hypothetical protein